MVRRPMERAIRLMTANLLAGRADNRHLAAILDQMDPDLVVTQEMGFAAANVLADRFPHHDLRPADDSGGRGVASRFEARFGEIPMPWRSGLWAQVDTGSRSFLLANVHMRNPIAFPAWRSVRIRNGQLNALFRWADEQGDRDQPFVLAGDLNATPAWPAYKRLAERWTDLVAHSAEEPGDVRAPTWAWRPGWPKVLRIDHVFGRDARVVSALVEPVRGSDHAALIVDLVFD